MTSQKALRLLRKHGFETEVTTDGHVLVRRDGTIIGKMLQTYHLLPAVPAAAMTRNVPERNLLLDRPRAATDSEKGFSRPANGVS